MSFQDRLSTQDPRSLLSTATSLALITASSTSGSNYNFPLMLFGIVTHEMTTAISPFRQFLTILLLSFIFDVFTLLTHPLSSFILLITILLTLLKAPIFFSCLAELRARGGDLRWDDARWTDPTASFRGLGGGGGGGSGRNWSMPGGFGGGPVGNAERDGGAAESGQGGGFPSSGGFRLGGDDDSPPASNVTNPGPPPCPPPSGRGGYAPIN